MNDMPRDTEDSVALLKQLINCRSITPQHDGALDLAQMCLNDAGYRVQRLPAGDVDNLWAADNHSPRLLFAGHVDVVPPGDLALWRGNPFVAEERDGFVYGRGAADMKSGVAAMICAAVNLRRRGVGGIAVLLTSDEEGAALHGTRHVVEWRQKNCAAAIPFAIVGEPTCEHAFGDTVKIGRRGSLTAHISVCGQQTHVAYPQNGDNPIPRLLTALQTILQQTAAIDHSAAVNADKNFYQTDTASGAADAFPPLGVQIVMLKSGVADNVIPATAQATINFRYAPRHEIVRLRHITETCLQQAAATQWKCEWRHGAEPFITAADSELVRALQNSIMTVCGRRATLSTGGGTSDGRFLRAICRQLAEFGTLNETMHAPNERVSCDSVRMLTDIYEKTASQLLLGDNPPLAD